MILQTLTKHYENLVEKGELERPGWQAVKVPFALQLDVDGRLLQIVDIRIEVNRKGNKVLVPKTLNVPAQVERTSGIISSFLCNNAEYMLGIDSKGKPKHAKACFEACAALHHKLLDGIDHPMAKAVLAFFDTWNPDTATEQACVVPWLKELTTGNLIFQLDLDYAQDVAEIREAWQHSYDGMQQDAQRMRCLVTGEYTEIARLHPSIKGVQNAQAMGVKLVSFDKTKTAFESYGHDGEQGLNAPVGMHTAFAYGAALNHLLSDRAHTLYLGDTTAVFWTDTADGGCADCLAAFIGADTQHDKEIDDAMHKLAQGLPADWAGISVDPDNHFYILGLSPNAARLSVRFFLTDTFGKLAGRMLDHHERMKIIPSSTDTRNLFSIRDMLDATVNQHSSDKKRKPLPQLSGDVLRAVLTGDRYPETLYQQVQIRIRAEKKITRERAAIIKAYLLRNQQETNNIISEVAWVKLNEETTYAPYVLGRLFAVLESLQRRASGGDLNTTIKDKYFNSACCTPAIIFPTLINRVDVYLKKLDGGLPKWYANQIGSLMCKLDEGYPARLSLADQGVFQLGYYHQTYQKKEDKENG